MAHDSSATCPIVAALVMAIFAIGLAVHAQEEKRADGIDELIARLRSANVDDRLAAARTLGELGPGAAKAVPELTRLLSNDDSLLQERAIDALGAIGAASLPAVPRLLELLIRVPVVNDIPLWNAVEKALARIGPGVVVHLVNVMEKKGTVSQKARSRSEVARLNAETRAWDDRLQAATVGEAVIEKIGKGAITPLQQILARAVRTKNDLRLWSAARLLSRLGQDGAPALSALRDALPKAATPETQEEIAKAIRAAETGK